MSKQDAKTTMLSHSEAKVKFYETYLQRYLRILYKSDFIEEINIFDIFCGTGIYDNDKKGSPLVAFDAIKALREEYDFNKRIRLVVNDGKSSKVTSVRSYIETNNQGHCEAEYYNEPAEVMFNNVLTAIATQTRFC
jgi:three-Cys-motif partner protein